MWKVIFLMKVSLELIPKPKELAKVNILQIEAQPVFLNKQPMSLT